MRSVYSGLLSLSLLGCDSATEPVSVGDCAVYPDGQFDYGQIGIGSCLAGPSSLTWVDAEEGPGGSTLIVTNANPYLDFNSGSVLSIARAGIPTGGARRFMHRLAEAGQAGAVPIDSFAGDLAYVPSRQLGAVSVRYSEGAESIDQDDSVVFVDFSEPLMPRLAPVGEEEATAIAVGADPLTVAYDEASGLGFVGNITSGTLSVLDLLSEPVVAVDAVPQAEFRGPVFDDLDSSGSRVLVADLDVEDPTTFPHDEWTLTFSEGRFQIALPSPEGVSHIFSSGQSDWTASSLGLEVAQSDTDGAWGELNDPQVWQGFGGTRMALVDTDSGSLVGATLTESGGVWGYESEALLEPRASSWDAVMGGPMVFVEGGTEWLFYDGTDIFGRTYIGVASSSEGAPFQRLNGGNPVVNPGTGNHDSDSVADPHVLYDEQMDLYRMFYSAYDGVDWSLMQATSADLVEWDVVEEPLLSGAAAPVAVYSNGQFRIWASAWNGVEWTLEEYTSVNGWSIDTTMPIEGWLENAYTDQALPPGVGLQALASESWSIEGAVRGMAGVSFQAGESHSESTVGWRIFLSAGARLGEDLLHSDGANGFSPSHAEGGLSQVFGTLTDADGLQRIGLVDISDEASIAPITVLSGRESQFDEGGVLSPVVFQAGTEWRMLYGGQSGGQTSIGLARSSNGLTWTADEEPVLEPGEDWDSLEVRPGSVSWDGETYTLWYSGNDGARERIGRASSPDGITWTREPGANDAWAFDLGSPGSFDDSSVADPFVRVDGETVHLWYSGFDGDQWSIGYAVSEDSGVSWERHIGPVSGLAQPVLQGARGSFDQLGARRPIIVGEEATGLQMIYTGQDAAVNRVGLALGQSHSVWHRNPSRATTGDSVYFETVPGDDGDLSEIPLGQAVDGFVTSGLGVTASLIDEERGFLILSSAASAYLYVIDIRDDSTPDFQDNLFEIEAILVASTVPGAIGFRAMALEPGGSRLYALNDSPESVMIFDLSDVVDDHLGQLHLQAVIGALPAARGSEKDKGSDTLASVGPSNLVIDGDRLYVANFNANSISVYDLSLGPHGTWTHEIPGVGENPHAMALSPDGSLLAVASFVGRLTGDRVGSQIAFIDTNTLEIVGWLSND